MIFQDILTEHEVPFHASGRETRAGWLNFQCPFCAKDPYMGYNVAYRYVNCWNCGKHPLWETLQLLTHAPLRECWQWASDLPCERFSHKIAKTGKFREPKGVTWLRGKFTTYLRTRGFSNINQLKDLWKVQAIDGRGGKLRWRLYIPIHLHGNIVSWTTRAIGTIPPRYLSAKDEESAVSIKNLVYGIDYCQNSIVLCEGPIDCWAIGPGAAAIMGLRASPAQIEQISRIPLRFICFDAEPKAQERAKQLMHDLHVFPGTTMLLKLETGKDPASASRKEIATLRKQFLDDCK